MMLQFALEYASRGWKVFPLKPRGKTPLTRDGFKSATTDRAQIRLWWEKWPDANIGIATGDGLVVLDFDRKSGGIETRKSLALPLTLEVSTGGGGYHFYFEDPTGEIRNSAGFLPGMDIRGVGGYVVAPPSIHESGNAYTWLNERPLAVLPEEFRVKPQQKPAAPKATQGVRGKLSRATMDFLVNGAPEGKWNDSLFKAAKNAYEQGYGEEEFIEKAEKIDGFLDEPSLKTISSAFRNEPMLPVNGNQALVDFIRRSTVFTNLADLNDNRVVDLKTGDVLNIEVGAIPMILGKDEFADFRRTNMRLVGFEYNPRSHRPTRVDSLGLEYFNTYEPPTWMREAFYSGQRIEPEAELPQIYQDFLKHLTAGHMESYEYLLDWLANSLRSRNFTMLTALGEPGIGKGTLGAIIKGLHGASNYNEVRDQIFKAQFNAGLANKTLVYVDEVELKDKAAMDRLKAVVNDYIEIERKGHDAATARNWASFYISSNHLDAIRVEGGDRRFSIIQLTDTKLVNTSLIGQVADFQAEENIAKLARYLMGRKITHNMLVPFRSERFELVKEASLSPWEDYVVFEWAPRTTKKVLLSELQMDIMDQFRMKVPPGRRRFEGLAKRFPDKLRFVRNKDGRCEMESLVGAPAEQPKRDWARIPT